MSQVRIAPQMLEPTPILQQKKSPNDGLLFCPSNGLSRSWDVAKGTR